MLIEISWAREDDVKPLQLCFSGFCSSFGRWTDNQIEKRMKDRNLLINAHIVVYKILSTADKLTLSFFGLSSSSRVWRFKKLDWVWIIWIKLRPRCRQEAASWLPCCCFHLCIIFFFKQRIILSVELSDDRGKMCFQQPTLSCFLTRSKGPQGGFEPRASYVGPILSTLLFNS